MPDRPRLLNRLLHRALLLLLLGASLLACQSVPPTAGSNPPRTELTFIDLTRFDRDLAAALSAAPPTVAVTFHDRVSPSALPARLQAWMSAIESGGGTVEVVTPPPTLTARGPVLLIGAITTLWRAYQAGIEASDNAQRGAAKGFDAQIRLARTGTGDTLVERIVFTQKPR
jgi:hypothetical protein